MKTSSIILMLVLALVGVPRALTGQNTSVDYFPGKSFRTASPESQGMDSGMLDAAISSIVSHGNQMHSIIIIRNGYKILDASFFPFQGNYKHVLASCTKSFVSALVGIAIDKSQIPDVQSKVVDFFSDRQVANPSMDKSNITIQNLLMMAGGFEWREGSFDSNDLLMQMQNGKDWAGFVLDRPVSETPGSRFNYNSGGVQLLSAILQAATKRPAADFAAECLFKPMGIDDWYWAMDPRGTTIGGSGLYLKAEDMAKFGYLFLRNGRWGGEQLVSERWVKESTSDRIETLSWPEGNYGYGYLWWMNKLDGFEATGRGGQFIFVLPRYDLVIVTTAWFDSSDPNVLMDELLRSLILPSIASDSRPKPENPAAFERLSRHIAQVGGAPPAVKVDPLPSLARKISDKLFAVDDGNEVRLTFDGSSEAIIATNFKGMGHEAMKIGLDGVWRINRNQIMRTPSTDVTVCKGSWANESTFNYDLKFMDGSSNGESVIHYSFKFKSESAFDFQIIAPWGDYALHGTRQ